VSIKGTSMLVALALGLLANAARPAAPPVNRVRPQDATFRDVIARCSRLLDSEAADGEACSDAFADVPRMLRQVFDADFAEYIALTRPAALTHNVTCLKPADADAAIRGDGLVVAEMVEGRVCDGCTGTCARMALHGFATAEECERMCTLAEVHMAPPTTPGSAPVSMGQLSLTECAASGDVELTLIMARVVERLRRATAHEYGLPLARLAFHSVFVSRWEVAVGAAKHGTPPDVTKG